MPPSPAAALLIGSLTTSYQRVVVCFDVATSTLNEQQVTWALLAYARRYVESPTLALLLDRALKEGQVFNHNEVFHPENAIGERVRQHALTVSAALQGLPDDLQDQHAVWIGRASAVAGEVAEHPEVAGEKLREVLSEMRSLFGAHLAGQDFWALPGRYNRDRHEARTLRSRLDFMVMSKPWYGADLVAAFAHAPESHSDPRVARLAWGTVQKIRERLKKRADGAEDDWNWHLGQGTGEVLHHVGVFHDWVVEQLLSAEAVESVLDRYRERVERFEAPEYRTVIRRRKPRTNADELEVRRRLCLYMHDRGLEPWVEVQNGESRADAVIRDPAHQGRVVVAFEGKVVRPMDSDDTVRGRLKDGARKAARYARQLGEPRGYLVVWWALDATPDLERRWPIKEREVVVKVIDVRGSPSSGADRIVQVEPPTDE